MDDTLPLPNRPIERSTPDLDLKLQIGKYEVQKALGKGATGTVYLAIDTFTGREVALKTIEPEVFRDPEFGAVLKTQFQNEGLCNFFSVNWLKAISSN